MTAAKTGEDITETICKALSLAIAEGALLPGMKLLDDVVAKHFGVSRTIARGALAILERERVVERRRNHGAFVASPDTDQAIQLLEARRALELAIVARAIDAASEDDLHNLENLTRNEDQVHSGTDHAAKQRIRGNFHIDLSRCAGNAVMTEMLQNVVARLSLVSALYERDGSQRCGAEHHRAILSAIRRRDRAAAIEAMQIHLEDMESMLDLTAPQDDRHSLSAVLTKFAPRSLTNSKMLGKV
jgi:DNA-binding GntR family transcriptional regulator